MKKLLYSMIILLSITLLFAETKKTEIVEYFDSCLNSKDFTSKNIELEFHGDAAYYLITSPKSDRIFYKLHAMHTMGNTKYIYTKTDSGAWFVKLEITLYQEPYTLEGADHFTSYWCYTDKLYLFDEDAKTFTELDKLTENPTKLPRNPSTFDQEYMDFLLELTTYEEE